MNFYKICKYNYSNKNYKNEWSSIKHINNFKMAREYIKVEKDYLKAILNFFYIYKKLKIKNVEIYDRKCVNKNILNKYKKFYIYKENVKDLIYVAKLCLRGKMWCKFVVNEINDLYICFGEDYYLLLGMDKNISIKDIILNTNLYYYKWHNVFE